MMELFTAIFYIYPSIHPHIPPAFFSGRCAHRGPNYFPLSCAPDPQPTPEELSQPPHTSREACSVAVSYIRGPSAARAHSTSYDRQAKTFLSYPPFHAVACIVYPRVRASINARTSAEDSQADVHTMLGVVNMQLSALAWLSPH